MLREQIVGSSEDRDGDGLESSTMDIINKINMDKDSLLHLTFSSTMKTPLPLGFRSNLTRAQMDGSVGAAAAEDASE